MKLSNLLRFGTGFIVGAIVGGAFIFSSVIEFEYMLEQTNKTLPECNMEETEKAQAKETKKSTTKATKTANTNSNK